VTDACDRREGPKGAGPLGTRVLSSRLSRAKQPRRNEEGANTRGGSLSTPQFCWIPTAAATESVAKGGPTCGVIATRRRIATADHDGEGAVGEGKHRAAQRPATGDESSKQQQGSLHTDVFSTARRRWGRRSLKRWVRGFREIEAVWPQTERTMNEWHLDTHFITSAGYCIPRRQWCASATGTRHGACEE
jgi:hypothetical protein